MIRSTIVVAAALVVASVGAANAVTITGTLTVTLSGFDGNLPSIVTAPTTIQNPNQNLQGTHPVFGTIGTGSLSNHDSVETYTSSIDLTLPAGITTFNFLQIDPAWSCGWGCTNNTDSGTVSVKFAGTGSDSGTLTSTGTFSAKYGGSTLACASSDGSSSGDTDCIIWGSSQDTFTVPGEAVTFNLVNAVDWDLVPQINVGVQSNQLTTPLPASFPLFAAGVGMFGWFGRRRKGNLLTR